LVIAFKAKLDDFLYFEREFMSINKSNRLGSSGWLRAGLVFSIILMVSPSIVEAKSKAKTEEPAANAAEQAPIPAGMCPLNSGGPSLLGTKWRLQSVYGHEVPAELKITMLVAEHTMDGFGGCNTYTAHFVQVGNRGFKVSKIDQTREGCDVIFPEPGAPSINVGNWEGNYLRVLRRAGSVQQQNDNTLHFYDFNGKPSVIFVKAFGDLTDEAPAEKADTKDKDSKEKKSSKSSKNDKTAKVAEDTNKLAEQETTTEAKVVDAKASEAVDESAGFDIGAGDKTDTAKVAQAK
jgi:hypothetical protein